MRAGTTILIASTAAIALVAGCAEPQESEGADGTTGGDGSEQEPAGEPDVSEGEGTVSEGTPTSGPMSQPWPDV